MLITSFGGRGGCIFNHVVNPYNLNKMFVGLKNGNRSMKMEIKNRNREGLEGKSNWKKKYIYFMLIYFFCHQFTVSQ